MPKHGDYNWPTNATERRLMRDGESGVEAVTSRTAPTNESHAQHSARPWRVESRIYIVGPLNDTLARATGFGTDLVDAEANAAFIVTSVNSHDALLAACKTARYVHEHTTAMTHDEFAQLEAAIALAEGR